ncbi:MAG: hypothetical protein ABSF77_01710 [Spirochaetia bacterium]
MKPYKEQPDEEKRTRRAERSKQTGSTQFFVNNATKSFLSEQGTLAEHVFQFTRKDRLTPLPMSDAEWKNLLKRLVTSCRKTADLLAKYKESVASFEGDKQEKPKEKSFENPIDLLNEAHIFYDGAEQSVGGLDKGLEIMAHYFESIMKRPPGRPKDIDITWIVNAKLVSFLSSGNECSVCYWNEYQGCYEGDFLDEMLEFLDREHYNYQSRDALAQRIKEAMKRIQVSKSSGPTPTL